MQRTFRLLAAALALPLVSGCIESTTLLKVGKDGSGTVTVREFYSPQLTQMMDGMAGMVQGIVPDGAEGAEAAPAAVDLFKDSIEKKAALMGPGVTITHREDVTNAAGWKGFLATYAFPDINKLNLGIGEGDADAEDGPAGFRFAFTPGSPAKLDIVPNKSPSAEQEAAVAEEATEVADMGGQMTAMMAPMIKGLRMTFLVQVDGAIVETNARHSIPDRNTVVVMDLPVEKLMGNPQALQLMTSKDPNMQKKLLGMDLPGVKLEDPSKTISVSFD